MGLNVWKSLKSAWQSHRLPPEVLLANQLAENPYHPYQIQHIGKYDIQVRYASFYVSILGSIACLFIIAVWIGLGIFLSPDFIASVSRAHCQASLV